jgi:putative membrane protein
MFNMNFLVKLIISAIAVLASAYILPGVAVADFWVALVVAALLAFFNVTVKPLLVLLTIPITIFTMGLFLLVINAAMILLIDWMLVDFMVNGFWWALVFSIILSLFVAIFESVAGLRNF